MSIFVASFIVTALIISSSADPLPINYQQCPSVVVNDLRSDEALPDEIQALNKKDIADEGHCLGFVPSLYNVNLHFDNEGHYHGNVWLTAKTIHWTKYMIFNIGFQSPEIDYKSIQVHQCQATGCTDRICIANITASRSEEVLLLEFINFLAEDTEYNITFGMFESSAFNERSSDGALGLRASQIDDSYALFTIFDSRRARTLFPCMDHPSLKAVFHLCLTVPKDFTAISNTRVEKPDSNVIIQNVQYCFQPTPTIPAYSFSFAIMRNYAKMYLDNPDVRLFVPNSQQIQFVHTSILSEAQNTIRSMINITNFTTRWNETNIFLANLPSHDSLGNMDLIGLDLGAVQYDAASAKDLVFHQIIRQWVDSTITIHNWKDECLAEGLTVYLGWLLSPEPDRIEALIRDRARNNIGEDNFSPNRELGNNDDKGSCFGRSPVILQTLIKMIEKETFLIFVSKLMANYQMHNVGIYEWEKALLEASKNRSIAGFFRNWFYQAGPITLEVRKSGSSVSLSQRVNDKIKFNPHVSVEVLCSNCEKPAQLIVGHEHELLYVHSPPPQWVLVDPDSQTLTRKIYETSTYMTMFDIHRQQPEKYLTKERIHDFTDDFCYALLANQLPLDRDTDKELWRTVFGMARNHFNAGSRCYCCVTPTLLWKEDCLHALFYCNSLSIVHLVNRY